MITVNGIRDPVNGIQDNSIKIQLKKPANPEEHQLRKLAMLNTAKSSPLIKLTKPMKHSSIISEAKAKVIPELSHTNNSELIVRVNLTSKSQHRIS